MLENRATLDDYLNFAKAHTGLINLQNQVKMLAESLQKVRIKSLNVKIKSMKYNKLKAYLFVDFSKRMNHLYQVD